MKREKVQSEPKADSTGKQAARDSRSLFLVVVVIMLNFVQLASLTRTETIGENGDFISRFKGLGVLPYMFNHFSHGLVFSVFIVLCVILGLMAITLTFRVHGTYLIALPFLIVSIFSIVLTPMILPTLMDPTEGKAEAYVDYQDIDDASVQLVDAGEDDLEMLKSSLGSKSLVDLSEGDSVQLMLVQEKGGGMSVYTVSESIKTVEDFELIGTVEDSEKLQVKSFFNNLDSQE